jgi:broad specificity phosphatase PhoE
MTAHLVLLRHGSTASTRSASFPLDEPIDDRGLRQIASLRGRLPHSDRCFVSPVESARQTAAELGFDATVEPALADCNFGRWRGQSLQQVQEQDPQGLAEWMREPAKAPHGGESILALSERIRAWLDALSSSRGMTLAITHASVIRAAIVVAIEAEPRSFWRIDVAPLSSWRLSGRDGRWNLVGPGYSDAETDAT